MIFALILITVGAVATVLACKSINAGFAAKNEVLDEKERQLNEDLKELREKRRSLKKDLEVLKNDFKEEAKAAAAKPVVDHGTLKSWLIDTDLVGALQFRKAEKYAEDKNMDLLSALLTLNMITVDTFEKAKQMKLRY